MNGLKTTTFGCRLNTFESEVIRACAAEAGAENTIVFNTCAVTSEAVRQARQSIRRARRENPDVRIVVTGCAAQIETDAFASMSEVDVVLGNREKFDVENYREKEPGRTTVRVGDVMASDGAPPRLLRGYAERARAFVQVQNGCDHRCTFCVIPHGRGNSRSVDPLHVIGQVRTLVDAGHAEVVLTGVDLTSYGSDLGEGHGLGALVRKILDDVPELKRLRLSSIDSIEVDETLMRVLAEEERFMPQLHLSLQSGDDMILKRMKRRHLREDAIDFCERACALRPDVAFGADLIAGFPTETEEMFRNSLRLIEECRIVQQLHVFPYSARPGTPAARMPQVDGRVKRERAARLREAGDRLQAEWLGRQVGKVMPALVETEFTARTAQNARVDVSAAAEIGNVVDVMMTEHADGRLGGRLAA